MNVGIFIGDFRKRGWPFFPLLWESLGHLHHFRRLLGDWKSRFFQCFMGISWEYLGNILGISWEYLEVEKLAEELDFWESLMGYSLISLTQMPMILRCYGNMMGKLWDMFPIIFIMGWCDFLEVSADFFALMFWEYNGFCYWLYHLVI